MQVTLCIPWLAPPDQAVVFNNITFERPEQQEEYVREWARKRTGLPCDFQIKFYPGRYAVEKCSILPVGDPTSYIPDNEVHCLSCLPAFSRLLFHKSVTPCLVFG